MIEFVRKVCEFLSNGKDYLVILLFAHLIKEREEGGLNGFYRHEGCDYRYFMDGIDF